MYAGGPLPHFNEVDECAGIDALLINRVHASLGEPIETTLHDLRWGDRDEQFVRPVRGLVMLHGDRVVPGTVLGQSSGHTTRGHRFLGKGAIEIARADDYEALLERDGKVIWNPSEPGVEFREVPDAPQPAETAAQLLRQMRAMAEKFTSTYSATHLDNIQGHPQDTGRSFQRVALVHGARRIPQDSHPQGLRQRFLEEFQPFAADHTGLER